jgi:hypothetical protein
MFSVDFSSEPYDDKSSKIHHDGAFHGTTIQFRIKNNINPYSQLENDDVTTNTTASSSDDDMMIEEDDCFKFYEEENNNALFHKVADVVTQLRNYCSEVGFAAFENNKTSIELLELAIKSLKEKEKENKQ